MASAAERPSANSLCSQRAGVEHEVPERKRHLGIDLLQGALHKQVEGGVRREKLHPHVIAEILHTVGGTRTECPSVSPARSGQEDLSRALWHQPPVIVSVSDSPDLADRLSFRKIDTKKTNDSHGWRSRRHPLDTKRNTPRGTGIGEKLTLISTLNLTYCPRPQQGITSPFLTLVIR